MMRPSTGGLLVLFHAPPPDDPTRVKRRRVRLFVVRS